MAKNVKEKYTGPQVRDTKTFIQKARWVHGDKYDYSKVEYVNTRSQLEIICPIHGLFVERADRHMKGRCCKKCQRTNKFIKSAKERHGCSYTYEKTVYINTRTDVVVTCPLHGDFKQKPDMHLKSRTPCSKCRKTSTDDFIRDAQKIHGKAYNYDKSLYVSVDTKIQIVCINHGVFYRTPYEHISKKRGCPVCHRGSALTTKTFIQRAKEVHGDKYNYDNVVYNGYDIKVEILCKEHGAFYATPHNHLNGVNCPTCSSREVGALTTLSFENYCEKARQVHGDKYNYDNSSYKNSSSFTNVTCPEHGVFRVKANSHLSGTGCPKCAGRNWSHKDWINSFISTHGHKYIYGYLDGVVSRDKIKILCPIHGEFEQQARMHRYGQGCKECAYESHGYGINGFYGTSNPSMLYVFRMDNRFIKVGLSKNIASRMTGINKESGYSVEKLYSVSGKANELFELEQKILRKSNLKRFYPEVPFGGQSECLELSELPKVLQIIEYWEKSNEESFSETS